jgi:hypothetical protein
MTAIKRLCAPSISPSSYLCPFPRPLPDRGVVNLPFCLVTGLRLECHYSARIMMRFGKTFGWNPVLTTHVERRHLHGECSAKNRRMHPIKW